MSDYGYWQSIEGSGLKLARLMGYDDVVWNNNTSSTFALQAYTFVHSELGDLTVAGFSGQVRYRKFASEYFIVFEAWERHYIAELIDIAVKNIDYRCQLQRDKLARQGECAWLIERCGSTLAALYKTKYPINNETQIREVDYKATVYDGNHKRTIPYTLPSWGTISEFIAEGPPAFITVQRSFAKVETWGMRSVDTWVQLAYAPEWNELYVIKERGHNG